MKKEQIKNLLNKALKKYWWYDNFRWNQEQAILELIKNKNIAYIEKTWGWKSIVYQIPALLKKGLTIVVSPLKSLMKDQVENLINKWIPATYLNSDLDDSEKKSRFIDLMNWNYKLLYVSPERLSFDKFIDYLIQVPWWISYFIIDEFDTVSEYWETWFRPEFLQLWEVKRKLEEWTWKRIPVWIFTATATKKTIDTVIEMMWVENNIKFFRWKLVWDNLHIIIKKYVNTADKDKHFYAYISAIQKQLKGKKWTAIIFCSTTKDVDNIYKILQSLKYKVAKYHWKMTTKMRESTYNKFIKDKVDFVVCTNAFWRWIDKANIRYILHYWTPWNISAYMQEIWRGWRDWKDYDAILLYCNQDVNKRRFILRWNDNSYELIDEYEKFLGYLEDELTCRIYNLYKYFWYDTDDIQEECWNCDNCWYTPNLLSETNLIKAEKQVEKNKKITKKKTSKRKTTKWWRWTKKTSTIRKRTTKNRKKRT